MESTKEKECNEHSGKILYSCDKKACKKCSIIGCGECEHTSDIRHAKDFELIGDSFWEKEISPH